MSVMRQQEQSQDRVVRRPFSGPQLKLQMSAEDRQAFTDRGMVPRWFNDQESRITRAEGAGCVGTAHSGAPCYLGRYAARNGAGDMAEGIGGAVAHGTTVVSCQFSVLSLLH